MKYFIILVPLFTILNSCNSRNENNNSIGRFDLSKDDTQILFSYNKEKKESIYLMNIDGGGVKLLLESKKKTSFSNPKFSIDGQNFLFVEHNSNEIMKSTLCIAKSDGTNIKHLMNVSGIITEAIFSNNKNEIIFCKANEYNKSSPIGIKSAHDFDIYSLNLLNKKVIRLTNIKAYGLDNISEINDKYILFRLETGSTGGMYIFDKNNSKQLKQFSPLNNPRNDKTMYYNPVYFSKYKLIVFVAPYELYKMGLNDKKAELINRSANNIQELSVFNFSPQILFIKEAELNFYIVDLNGDNLKKIPLKIN